MNFRRAAFLLVSLALGAVLVWFLVRLGSVDVRTMLRRLEGVRIFGFLELVILNSLVIQISSIRWRSIDAALRHPSDSVPSRVTSFSVTAVGMAVGMILPVQLGMTASRTAGIHPYGRTLKRGAGGTLFEQSFDLLVVVLFGFGSGVTWVCKGGALMWTILALAGLAAGLLGMRPVLWLFRRLLARVSGSANRWLGGWKSRRGVGLFARALLGFSEIEHSELLNEQLGRRLLLLSAARIGILVLMAVQTAAMTGAHIAPWQMAAAAPFAALANLLALTPGAVGVNELTFATALHLFGVPLGLASQWVLANRILLTASCFSVAAFAAIALSAERVLGSGAVAVSRPGGGSVRQGSMQGR